MLIDLHSIDENSHEAGKSSDQKPSNKISFIIIKAVITISC